MGVGALSMLVPMFNAELAPPGIRGSLVALQQLAITFGIMVSFSTGLGIMLPRLRRLRLTTRFPTGSVTAPTILGEHRTILLPVRVNRLRLGEPDSLTPTLLTRHCLG